MAKATSRKSATTIKRATVKSTVRSTSAKAATTKSAAPTAMGLRLRTWAGEAKRARASDVRGGRRGFVFAFANQDSKLIKKNLVPHLNKWQMLQLLESDGETVFFQGTAGPVWVLRPTQAGNGALEKSSYARFRDLAGATVGQLPSYRLEKLILEMHGLTLDEERAVICGLEIASYAFQENRFDISKDRKSLPALLIKEAGETLNEHEIQAAANLGLSINVARHYTNLPPGDLNPRTYAESVQEIFSASSTVEVDVWEGEKLAQEKMNMLIAVGQASNEGPRFVHMRYRPKNSNGAQPIALVGKGITFDSGGLDIKPSSGMRWMKKDMGGSAAVVGLVMWAEKTEYPNPIDAYISLAENAVGSRSFRPGDVLVARSGMSVEISNTDAEGRLVLGDALDVAVSQEGADKPSAVINIATLTGANKVALGADIAGLFTNSDHLAGVLSEAGLSRGDLMWRLPLYQPYRSQLKSNFADCMNCSEGGFGGAITAALFLESFVKGVPWAHLDIFAWKDSASGAWAESGGSGQTVQALSEALMRLASESTSEEMA